MKKVHVGILAVFNLLIGKGDVRVHVGAGNRQWKQKACKISRPKWGDNHGNVIMGRQPT